MHCYGTWRVPLSQHCRPITPKNKYPTHLGAFRCHMEVPRGIANVIVQTRDPLQVLRKMFRKGYPWGGCLLAVRVKCGTVPKRYHPRSTAMEFPMAAYTCDKCGMSVNMTCGQCGQDLVHDTLTTDDGSTVEVSKCPDGHGMIKSPMCCAQDMACAV